MRTAILASMYLLALSSPARADEPGTALPTEPYRWSLGVDLGVMNGGNSFKLSATIPLNTDRPLGLQFYWAAAEVQGGDSGGGGGGVGQQQPNGNITGGNSGGGGTSISGGSSYSGEIHDLGAGVTYERRLAPRFFFRQFAGAQISILSGDDFSAGPRFETALRVALTHRHDLYVTPINISYYIPFDESVGLLWSASIGYAYRFGAR